MSRIQLNACDTIQDSVSNILNIREYLQPNEETAIHLQFESTSWKPNCQVLWSGLLREQAQTWADAHNMQTLTTAMGPLMDSRTPQCPQSQKSCKGWKKYIHGASAVFAWHIARCDVVTVLSPPPPQRFHPSGQTYFQTIEERILQEAIDDGAALRIELIHPLVEGAQEFRYQYLPHDEKSKFTATFGATPCRKYVWRPVKRLPAPMGPSKPSERQVAASRSSTTSGNQTSTHAATCSVTKVGLSKSERKSLNGRGGKATCPRPTSNTKTKAGPEITAQSSSRSTRSTTSTEGPAPKLTKARKKKRKRKRSAVQESQQKKQSTVKQTGKKTKKRAKKTKKVG